MTILCYEIFLICNEPATILEIPLEQVNNIKKQSLFSKYFEIHILHIISFANICKTSKSGRKSESTYKNSKSNLA